MDSKSASFETIGTIQPYVELLETAVGYPLTHLAGSISTIAKPIYNASTPIFFNR